MLNLKDLQKTAVGLMEAVSVASFSNTRVLEKTNMFSNIKSQPPGARGDGSVVKSLSHMLEEQNSDPQLPCKKLG